MKNIFIAQKLSNGKLDEICVTILNLNVFGTLTWTFYGPISVNYFLQSTKWIILDVCDTTIENCEHYFLLF